MTDRRPDVHCDGCGTYCYSLSHRSEEQNFPEKCYCAKCRKSIKKGVKPGGMIEHEWYTICENFIDKLESSCVMTKRDIRKLHSFAWTMNKDGQTCHRTSTKGKKYENGKILPMTAKEWKALARKKLDGFLKYCSQPEKNTIESFIGAVNF